MKRNGIRYRVVLTPGSRFYSITVAAPSTNATPNATPMLPTHTPAQQLESLSTSNCDVHNQATSSRKRGSPAVANNCPTPRALPPKRPRYSAPKIFETLNAPRDVKQLSLQNVLPSWPHASLEKLLKGQHQQSSYAPLAYFDGKRKVSKHEYAITPHLTMHPIASPPIDRGWTTELRKLLRAAPPLDTVNLQQALVNGTSCFSESWNRRSMPKLQTAQNAFSAMTQKPFLAYAMAQPKFRSGNCDPRDNIDYLLAGHPTIIKLKDCVSGSVLDFTHNCLDLLIDNPRIVKLQQAATLLQVEKPHFQDITIVLDGIELVAKMKKNSFPFIDPVKMKDTIHRAREIISNDVRNIVDPLLSSVLCDGFGGDLHLSIDFFEQSDGAQNFALETQLNKFQAPIEKSLLQNQTPDANSPLYCGDDSIDSLMPSINRYGYDNSVWSLSGSPHML